MNSTIPISRRCFIHGALLLTASAGLAACAPGTATPDSQQNYYVTHKKDVLKDIQGVLGYVEKIGASRYGAEEATRLKEETLTLSESMLPDLPYIGGASNDLTENLCQAVGALAFYRTMLAHGKTLAETGELLYRGVDAMVSSTPLAGASGRMALSKATQDELRQEAAISQQRQYTQDWVFHFVEGDGSTFDMGVDYVECGICKYYAAQKASELTPYLCLLDFPVSRALNTGLVRITTLGQGGSRCDFRYKTGRDTQMEWTPDFLKAGGAS